MLCTEVAGESGIELGGIGGVALLTTDEPGFLPVEGPLVPGTFGFRCRLGGGGTRVSTIGGTDSHCTVEVSFCTTGISAGAGRGLMFFEV